MYQAFGVSCFFISQSKCKQMMHNCLIQMTWAAFGFPRRRWSTNESSFIILCFFLCFDFASPLLPEPEWNPVGVRFLLPSHSSRNGWTEHILANYLYLTYAYKLNFMKMCVETSYFALVILLPPHSRLHLYFLSMRTMPAFHFINFLFSNCGIEYKIHQNRLNKSAFCESMSHLSINLN